MKVLISIVFAVGALIILHFQRDKFDVLAAMISACTSTILAFIPKERDDK